MSNYEGFVSRLQKSRASMFRVGQWLHLHGMSIYIPAIRVAPKDGNNEEYFDECDIQVECPKRGRFKIEVKHINTNFTGKDDWPHGKTTIVSNQGTIERNWGKIRAYILVNKNMTHAMIIRGDTCDKWEKKTIFATNTNKDEVFYVCLLEHVSFVKIVE